MRCLENFVARGPQRSEDKDLHLSADIRAIGEPHTYEALIAKGHSQAELPSERTLRDILTRMNDRLKRIQKGKPLKKTEETAAIFANVKDVREKSRDAPEVLEISMDTKAKVRVGDDVRGGKNPDRRSG